MSTPKRITSLYAWIATEADGKEGVPGHDVVVDGHRMLVPLIGADMERMISLMPEARNVQTETGVRMRLCRFQLVDELDELL